MALSAGSVEIRLFAELARLQSDMKKANKVVEDAMGGIQKTVRATTTLFNNMAASFGAAQIIKLADDYKRFDAQLKLSTKSLNEYNEAYKNVIRIGRTAQSDIGAIGVLYARLNNNLRDFNVTQKQVADVTETISLALRTNNATVQETNSVMLQLSQSFGSGKLNGQEFLAVAEGAPMLLRQLAASLKVPYGALKDLSAQGKITREDLLKAWSDPAYIAGLREQVKEVGTVTSAITVLMNNLKQYIGESDKSTSATKTLSAGIMLVADSINYLVSGALAYGAVALVKWSQSQYAALAASQAASAQKVIAAKVELSLAQAAYASGAAITRQTAAMANNAAATTLATSNTARLIAAQRGLAAATSTTAAAARGFGLVLSAFGGWIGLAITGVILFADKLLALYDRVRGLTPELKALNDEMERRNRLENIGVNAASKSAEQEEALVGQVKLYNEINAQIVRQKSLIESRKGFGLNVDKENVKLAELEKRLRAQASLMGTNLNQANALTPAINQNAEAFGKLSEKLQTAKELADEYAKNQALIIIEGSKAGLTQAEIAAKLKLLKEEYDKATGATKASKEATKDAAAAEKERAEGIKQLVLEQKAFVEAQADARNAVILDAASENEALAKQIEKAQERIDLLNMGEEAQNRMAEARLQDAIATAEQNVQQAINNGATQDAIKFAEDYLFALKERLALQKKLSKLESEEERIKSIKAVEKARVEETKRANKEIEDANDRLYKNLARSITDSIVRGFENGLSFIDNFKQAITNAFKSFFVNVGVNFVQGALQQVFGNVTKGILGSIAGIFSGGAMAGDGVATAGLLDQAKNVFDVVTKGFDAANIAFEQGIQQFGSWVTEFGSIGESIGGAISQYSGAIASALPYAGAVLKLIQGDITGAAFQGGGVAIGSLLGGPIGGAIGGFLGSALGGLFGGEDIPLTGDQTRGSYAKGISSVTSNVFGESSVGAAGGLEQLTKAFSDRYGALLSLFDPNASFTTNAIFRNRTNQKAYFGLGGGISDADKLYSNKNAGFEDFVKGVLGEGLAKAIQKAAVIPTFIKELFKGITDQQEIVNMIGAVSALTQSSVQLSSRFGLTVETASKLAKETGLTGDALVAFINKLAGVATSLKTPAQQILEYKKALTDELGGNLPATVDAFDSVLKSFNTTTEAGRALFLEMFNLRDAFIQFTQAMGSVKKGVDDAIFSLLSPQQQALRNRARLEEEFAKFNLAVPKSTQQLIAIGEGIDYTTEAGLTLALAFPTLVQAFQAVNSEVLKLNSALSPDRFRTFTDFVIANAYAAYGQPIPTANMPSYDVGTAYVPKTGAAMIHQGERILTRAENADMTMNSGKAVALLTSLVDKVSSLEYDMKRTADGTQRTARELEDITSGDVTITTQAA